LLVEHSGGAEIAPGFRLVRREFGGACQTGNRRRESLHVAEADAVVRPDGGGRIGHRLDQRLEQRDRFLVALLLVEVLRQIGDRVRIRG
jgi:hypothetical protein